MRNLYRLKQSENKTLSNSLLLTAHPDDESMFLSPFLYYNNPFILCLSNGNFNNLGKVREKEMKSLCNKRKLKYKILNYQDNKDWNIVNIVIDLMNYVIKYKITNIVTFDKYGVSGHKNHKSCYKAVQLFKYVLVKLKKRKYFKNKMDTDKIQKSNNLIYFKFYNLKTSIMFKKYFFNFQSKLLSYKIPLFSFYGFENMLYHKSQMNLLRYFYCVFSNYMNYNEFYEDEKIMTY